MTSLKESTKLSGVLPFRAAVENAVPFGIDMNKDSLLARLNGTLAKKYNPVISVTPNMLEGWNEAGIFPSAVARGRTRENQKQNWDYGCRHYRRALQICRIMDFLTHSGQPYKISLIRIELWLMGISDVQFYDLCEDLGKEFTLIRNKALKPITSDFDPDHNKTMSPRREAALAKQIGNAQPEILPKGFSYHAKELIGFLQFSGFGKSLEKIPNLITRIFERMGVGFLINPDEAEYRIFSSAMRAFWNTDDETIISTQEIIKLADEQTFILAREFANHFKLMDLYDFPAEKLPPFFRKISVFKRIFGIIDFNAAHGRWRIIFFLQFLTVAYRDPSLLKDRLEDMKKFKHGVD